MSSCGNLMALYSSPNNSHCNSHILDESMPDPPLPGFSADWMHTWTNEGGERNEAKGLHK